jgi:hypothetical protein
MSSMMETAVAAPAKPAAPVLARVLELKPQDSKLACATADGREFMLTRLIGSNVRIGDEMAVADSSGTATANTEVYIRKPSVRGTDVYQLKAGYRRATLQPRPQGDRYSLPGCFSAT